MRETTETSSSIGISADVCPSISYAAWQNSVPLIKSLIVQNEGNECYKDLTLLMSVDDGCARLRHDPEGSAGRLDRYQTGIQNGKDENELG